MGERERERERERIKIKTIKEVVLLIFQCEKSKHEILNSIIYA